jgi:GT2 family glycosyltransferase
LAVPAPLTLVIINWNARDHLQRCLAAALPLGYPITVVDNASSDGSRTMVAKSFPTVTLIPSDVNLGFAGGVNAGVATTTSPWVLILNPDVEVTAAAVDLLRRAGAADAAVGAVGACLVGDDDRPQAGFAVRRFPTLATLAVDLLLVDKLWPGNPASARYLARDVDLSVTQDVEQPAAASLLIRREAFDAVGGFYTGFHPAWFEDVDFCRRLHAAGWRIRYVAEARLRHEGGVAMRSLGLGSFNRVWYRNMRRYVDRHLSWPARLAFRGLLAAGMVLRGGVSLLRGRPRDARAYLSVLPVTFGHE